MKSQALTGGGTLPLEYSAPPAGGVTFVFVNALTGDRSMWTGRIAERLEAAGHGWLAWNLRGQAETDLPDNATYTTDDIVGDLVELIEGVGPARPVLAGLSIGGLYALHAIGRGVQAEGLVLINTLRRDGPRLKWLNDAIKRAAEVGGPALIRDLFSPLLMNEDWQRENRQAFLGEGVYEPIDRDGGIYKLLDTAGDSDWNVPYEDIDLPVLVMTGLQDRVFYNAADVETLTARLPAPRPVAFPDAGHMIPAERPDAFADVLIEFAKDL